MPPKGIENAEAITTACEKTLARLDSTGDPEWREVLESVVDIMEQMKPKFFLKTNPAIPITNKCRKDVEELQAITDSGDLNGFPLVLERFRKNMEDLLKRSSMEGVIIT